MRQQCLQLTYTAPTVWIRAGRVPKKINLRTQFRTHLSTCVHKITIYKVLTCVPEELSTCGLGCASAQFCGRLTIPAAVRRKSPTGRQRWRGRTSSGPRGARRWHCWAGWRTRAPPLSSSAGPSHCGTPGAAWMIRARGYFAELGTFGIFFIVSIIKNYFLHFFTLVQK